MKHIHILFLILILTSCAPTKYKPRYTETRPVATPIAAPQKAITIVIDPGHGGKDQGAHGKAPNYQEKHLNLVTAMMVKKYLQQMGYRTIMTRADDTFVPLDVRSSFANSNETDLFVSVHYNASQSTDAQGIEVFYYKSDKAPDRTVESKRLGDLVLGKIISETHAKSRGVKHGDLAVVRETKMPAILVEGGFLTNETERSKILDPNYVKRLAWGIASGVREYIRQSS